VHMPRVTAHDQPCPMQRCLVHDQSTARNTVNEKQYNNETTMEPRSMNNDDKIRTRNQLERHKSAS